VEGSLVDAKKASDQFIKDLRPAADGAAAWGAGDEFLNFDILIIDQGGQVLAKRRVTEQTWSDTPSGYGGA
jgi:hypothetical protein